jgi:hypothetical protein
LFDFEGSHSQNVTNTVITVARLSRFVIADITDPRTVPYELAAIVKHAEEVPIKPLFTGTKTLTLEALPTGYKDLLQQDQVLALRHYRDRSDLLASFENAIIEPAENKFNDLQVARLRALEEKLPIKGTRRKPVSTE